MPNHRFLTDSFYSALASTFAAQTGLRRTMMRLGFLALGLVLLVAPLATEAQPAGKVYRIGFLYPGAQAFGAARLAQVQQGLRDLGYVEGQNAIFEVRWAEGNPERLAQYAAELARLKVDVIVTAAAPGARAAKDATGSIPLVMIDPGDPVAAGLVASMARPGGNATGLTSIAPELAGKHIELLREILPHASGIMFLFNAANRDAGVALSQTRAVGDRMGLRVDAVPIEGVPGLETALEEVRKRRPPAVIIYPDPLTFAHRERLARFAGELGIATFSAAGEFADAGVLLTYGPNFSKMFRDAAMYIHKILTGTRPADLPVEQPTRFELIINVRTAKALGITIPPSLRIRADRIVE